MFAAPALPFALAATAGTLSSLMGRNYHHENKKSNGVAHVCSNEVPGALLCSDCRIADDNRPTSAFIRGTIWGREGEGIHANHRGGRCGASEP